MCNYIFSDEIMGFVSVMSSPSKACMAVDGGTSEALGDLTKTNGDGVAEEVVTL